MTPLVRWNPTNRTRSLRTMQTDMDRLIESFFETPKVTSASHANLALDVVETETSYLISAALPGLKAEEIDMTVEDGVLTISGELKSNFDFSGDSEDEKVTFHLRERFYGGFSRKLRLPKDVDTDEISASHEDGVLTITLAKSEAAQPKKIIIS